MHALLCCREDYAACPQLLLRAPAAVLDAHRVTELSTAITISLVNDRDQGLLGGSNGMHGMLPLGGVVQAQADVQNNPVEVGGTCSVCFDRMCHVVLLIMLVIWIILLILRLWP